MKQQMRTNQIEWREVKLKDICSVDSGQGAPQGDKYFLGEEVFVRAGDLNSLTEGNLVGDFCKKITSEAINKYKLKKFRKNSIVFPKSGMSIKTDNIALLKYDSYVVNHLTVLGCKKVNEKFLFYLLKKNKISNLCNATSYPSIRISDINNYKVSIPFSNGSPDIKEQERIVKILEKSEKLNERGKRAEELLDEFLKSIFYEMFYSKGFEEINLGDEKICLIKGEYGSGASAIKYDGKTRYIRITDITENGTLKNENVSPSKVEKKYLLQKGDLLFARSGATVGKTYLHNSEKINYQYAGYLIRYRFNNKIIPEYVYYFTKTPLYRGWINSKQKVVAQPNINAKQYSSLKIPLPPLPLQQKFAKIVEQVEKMKENINKTKQNSEELFNSLVSKAFRGEL